MGVKYDAILGKLREDSTDELTAMISAVESGGVVVSVSEDSSAVPPTHTVSMVTASSTYTYVVSDGARGPEGPRGSQGPQGVPGPAGPRDIYTEISAVDASTVELEPGQAVSWTVPASGGTLEAAGISAGVPVDRVAFALDYENPLLALTGQEMQVKNQYGSPTVGAGMSVDGVPCIRLDDGNYLEAKSWKGLSGDTPRSVSAWIKANTDAYGSWSIVCWGQNWSNGKLWNFEKNENGHLILNGYYADVEGTTNLRDGKWHHCCAVYYGGVARVFVDGVLEGSGNVTLNTGSTIPFRVGGNDSGDPDYSARGYLAAVRVYSRALTFSEIRGLAREFSP